MTWAKKPTSDRDTSPVELPVGSGAPAPTKRFDKKPGASSFSGTPKLWPKKTLHRQWRLLSGPGPSARVEELVDVIAEHMSLRPMMRRLLRRKLAEKLAQQLAQSLTHRSPPIAADSTPLPVPAPGDVLTTQEAADLVGVSRPYLVRFVDSGAIPLFQLVGNQRRVLKSAVLAWWQEERDGRRRAMRLLADDIAEELRS